MSRGRSTAAALALCGLALCALGATSAFATEGLTAVQCEKAGPGSQFESSHCETPATGGEYETVPFALNETVPIEGTGVTTAILHSTLGLSKVTITCEVTTTTGHVTNVTPEGSGGEMKIHGTEAVTHYSKCEAHLESKPEEACVVEGITGAPGEGKIDTVGLTSTSQANHKIKITSSESEEFITQFKVKKQAATEGKACNLPETNVTVRGSVIGTANTEKHSHITFSGEGTLTANKVATTYTGTTVGHTPAEPGQPTEEQITVGATTFP